MGTDRRLFVNVSVWYPRHNSYHYMVLGCLHVASLRDLPGGGMPGPSGDKDGNAGALPAPACLRHRGHYGGGKPPPPTVFLMQHSVPPARPERQAPGHGSVCQGSRAEEAAARRGGDDGELGAGLQAIRGTYKEFFGIWIPREGVEGRRL